jgi:6-pyruvoyl-tetrahydropterin synthase
MKNYLIMKTLTFSILFAAATIAVFGQDGKNKSNTKNTSEKKEQHNPENENKTPSKSTEAAGVKKEEVKMGTLKNHSIEIQKIIKNENGVMRGYDFGTSKQKIKDTEDAKYIADGKDFMIYEVVINENEKAEIIYYLDENNNVKGFGIEFLINPVTMAENIEATLIDDFQNYFNERYGKFVVNEKNDEVWTSKDGSYTVEMGDSSETDTMIEIEIEIFRKK